MNKESVKDLPESNPLQNANNNIGSHVIHFVWNDEHGQLESFFILLPPKWVRKQSNIVQKRIFLENNWPTIRTWKGVKMEAVRQSPPTDFIENISIISKEKNII